MIKHTQHIAGDYALYCKVWASVYRKHAKTQVRSMYSCYVRDGILGYIKAHDRAEFLAGSAREGLCGAYIAKALLAQGMSADDIVDCNGTMQEYVDAVEGAGQDAVDSMEGMLETYHHALEFACRSNGIRYAWALMGAPEMPCDVYEEDDEEDVYEDVYEDEEEE